MSSDFSDYLRDALHQHGTSQADLARALHVTSTAVCAYLSGASLPRFSLLQPIASALSCNYREVLQVYIGTVVDMHPGLERAMKGETIKQLWSDDDISTLRIAVYRALLVDRYRRAVDRGASPDTALSRATGSALATTAKLFPMKPKLRYAEVEAARDRLGPLVAAMRRAGVSPEEMLDALTSVMTDAEQHGAWGGTSPGYSSKTKGTHPKLSPEKNQVAIAITEELWQRQLDEFAFESARSIAIANAIALSWKAPLNGAPPVIDSPPKPERSE